LTTLTSYCSANRRSVEAPLGLTHRWRHDEEKTGEQEKALHVRPPGQEAASTAVVIVRTHQAGALREEFDEVKSSPAATVIIAR